MDETGVNLLQKPTRTDVSQNKVQSYDDLLSSSTPVIIALCNIGSQKSGNYNGWM